jgi:hypothetical protein
MKQFVKAARNSCKIKMALQGPSGSGKTYSALLVAFGLTKDWSKIAVIDSENGSAHLYSELGDYSVLGLNAPFTPESYIEAVDLAVNSGFKCLIIDSLSAEWSGQGGILDIHSNIPGNSFSAWAKVTPRHNAFLQKILQADIHVIGTMRSKTDYIMSEKNGKQIPEKVGLKAVQREDSEYEFTLVFELSQRHQAAVSKDRTGLFINKPELHLSEEVGNAIAEWCQCKPAEVSSTEERTALTDNPDFRSRIKGCKTVQELIDLFNDKVTNQTEYKEDFARQKAQLVHGTNGKHTITG